MNDLEEEDIVVRFVHTADWHLGRRFPAFSEADRVRLSRARLDSVDRILGVARQHNAQAILCAGDLFDEPDPGKEWWEPLSDKLNKTGPSRPIFLLPGNHDPLESGSVYQEQHPFRRSLPHWVHVIDRDAYEYPILPEVVLYATPCRSRAGQDDPTLSIPRRQPGDERIRIGMVHGNTFDMEGHQTNFPIGREAASRQGLDYLAIGDHHGYRQVPPLEGPPAVYPGTHEPMTFGESRPGNVTVVSVDRYRKARPKVEQVCHWTWEDMTCRSIAELRNLCLVDRKSNVLRLKLEFKASAPEYEEVEKILRELRGTDAVIGRVGIMQLDRTGLVLDTSNIDAAFDHLPEVLQATVDRLKGLESGPQGDLARQALLHLYQTLKEGV